MTASDLDQQALANRARRLAAAGEEAGAAAAYEALLQRTPDHVGALSFLAMRLFQRGDLVASLAYIDRAITVAPPGTAAVLLRNRAAIHGARGDLKRAEMDLRGAMAIEPEAFVNPLQLGGVMERAGDLTEALIAYRTAYRLEPRIGDPAQSDALPPPLAELARQARRVARAWLTQRFDAALAAARERHPDASLARVERAIRIHLGDERPEAAHPQQRPAYLFVPDLPATPWIEREEAPWAAALEAETAAIRAEFMAVQGGAGFEPYIDAAPERTDAWLKLEKQDTWNSFFFYRNAERVDENCARCPATLAALAEVPVAQARGVPGEAFFSVLAPGGHIPPHFGLTNAKVVVHLPLMVPDGCSIRVGPETREWAEGHSLMFDDSFEHEARNTGDSPRAVLIFEIWNPRLAPAEVVALGGVLDALEDLKRL